MVVDAWQLKEGKLQRMWRWDGDEENPVVRSMGAHSMVPEMWTAMVGTRYCWGLVCLMITGLVMVVRVGT